MSRRVLILAVLVLVIGGWLVFRELPILESERERMARELRVFENVPAVVDSVKIPVIAAGGIADSRGYKAAFALGAQGVQVGTAFMASKECSMHEDIKNLMIEAAETDTALMGSGRAFSRTLLTPDMKRMLADDTPSPPGDIQNRSVLRDAGFRTTTTGQCVGLLRSIRSVKEIVKERVS